MRKLVLVLSALFAYGLPCAEAATIHVPDDQPTIQSAINAATDGDVVEVDPGTYFENINFLGKAIEVTSADGPNTTIIDGGGINSVVIFSSDETARSILSGFTITHGLANGGLSEFEGGGIYIAGSSPTILDNIITANGACEGAGIAVSFGSPVIENNQITDNSQQGCSGGTGGGGILLGGAASAQVLSNVISGNSMTSADGGGISLFAAGTPLIENNLISQNTVTGSFGGCFGGPTAFGGGISMFNQSDALVIQNLISDNSADIGGGVAFLVPSGARGPFLINNTIVGNNVTQGIGSAVFASGFDSATELINNLLIGSTGINAVYCDDTCFASDNPLLFQNNDAFSESGTAVEGACSDDIGESGNISADPMFVDAAAGDFQLMTNSPAIDAGSNSAPDLPPKDFDGNPRIVNGTVDMGVFEFQTTTATPTPTATPSATPTPGGSISLIPSRLDYGPTRIWHSSDAQTVTLTNGSERTFTIRGWSVDVDFVVVTNTCRSALKPGQSCEFEISFQPRSVGIKDELFRVFTSTARGTRAVRLRGVCIR